VYFSRLHSAELFGRQALLDRPLKIFARNLPCGIFNFPYDFPPVNSNYIHRPFGPLHDQKIQSKKRKGKKEEKQQKLVEANPSSFGQVDLLSPLGLGKHESFLVSAIKQKLIAQQGLMPGCMYVGVCVWGGRVMCQL